MVTLELVFPLCSQIYSSRGKIINYPSIMLECWCSDIKLFTSFDQKVVRLIILLRLQGANLIKYSFCHKTDWLMVLPESRLKKGQFCLCRKGSQQVKRTFKKQLLWTQNISYRSKFPTLYHKALCIAVYNFVSFKLVVNLFRIGWRLLLSFSLSLLKLMHLHTFFRSPFKLTVMPLKQPTMTSMLNLRTSREPAAKRQKFRNFGEEGL